MVRKRKQPEPEQEAGAPEWMVTFSDCMTLLLTFFVLLLSFSSFDEKDLFRLRKSFCEELPGVSLEEDPEEALLAATVIQHNSLDEGSEKNALEEKSKDNLIKESESKYFREQKVFLSSSEAIFWGNGSVISRRGRKVLSDMALFLVEVPDRIVVSENGQGGKKGSENLGLQRAWAVIEYFTKKYDLDKGRFSITEGTLQKNYQKGPGNNSNARTGRMLEVVLLERSIYN